MESRRAILLVLAAVLFCCWIGYAEKDASEGGKKIGLRDAFRAFWCILRYGLRD